MSAPATTADPAGQQHRGALVNPVSGKCLDDPGFDTADGTQLDIYTCNGGASQEWALPVTAAGTGGPRAGRRA